MDAAGTKFSLSSETDVTKDNRSSNNHQNKQSIGHNHRPEIRDNLDSRANEEQETKGDDVTNNHKDVHNNSKGARKEKHDNKD